MTVTFGKRAKEFAEPRPYLEQFDKPLGSSDDPRVSQFEVFGRLNLSSSMIGAYIGMSAPAVSALMARTDFRRAYDKGRAEAIIAVRQKQLALALGGNVAMLTYAGEHFADQKTDAEPPPPANNRDWNVVLLNKAAEIRARHVSDEQDETAYSQKG